MFYIIIPYNCGNDVNHIIIGNKSLFKFIYTTEAVTTFFLAGAFFVVVFAGALVEELASEGVHLHLHSPGGPGGPTEPLCPAGPGGPGGPAGPTPPPVPPVPVLSISLRMRL
tara:strand:- start:879 stop:1214 length:336 start_codon:yes stop_codon:yes gene_type:complete